MLPLVLYSCVSVLVSVDIGSESMRVSMMQRGSPVSIVPNAEGRRFTPAVAAILPVSESAPAIFTDEEVRHFQRSVGDSAVVQRFPGHTTRFLPQLLGKNYSNKLVSYFMKRNLTMPFDADDDKYLELIAAPEFFAAQLILVAVEDTKRTKVNRTVDRVALVVPKFLTHHQRAAFVRSAKLATYKPVLVDSMRAVGTLFAVERSQLFKKRVMMVCFVDIGASQMQVSIQEFKKDADGVHIEEIGYAWTDQYGGYSVDSAFAAVIRREVAKQKKDAVFDEKSVQRILAAARRVKHELTLQPEVTLFLEDLVHGFDMSFTYSLDKLKKLCRAELKALNETFWAAFNQAMFSEPDDIDRFELIGGGTRSPIFINAINETFHGKVPVLRSLNSEEANVIGCGYTVAASMGGFLTQDISFKGVDPYNITIEKGRYMSFSYAPQNKLPVGIKSFIRCVDPGQKGQYEIVDGMVKVHGCRKLTRSGLYKDKMSSVEKTLQAFETKEQAEAEKDEKFHEFETFLLELRDKISKDPTALTVVSEDERMNALKLIASYQYQVQTNRNIEDDELKRMRNDVDIATKGLLKRINDKKGAPKAYRKLQDLLDSINTAVENDWPMMGLRPKSKLLRSLGNVCSRTEKWLVEHESNLDGVSVDDVDLMYEKLRKAFEIVKNNLRQSKHRKTDNDDL